MLYYTSITSWGQHTVNSSQRSWQPKLTMPYWYWTHNVFKITFSPGKNMVSDVVLCAVMCVNEWVLNSCAKTQCHNGQPSPKKKREHKFWICVIYLFEMFRHLLHLNQSSSLSDHHLIWDPWHKPTFTWILIPGTAASTLHRRLWHAFFLYHRCKEWWLFEILHSVYQLKPVSTYTTSTYSMLLWKLETLLCVKIQRSTVYKILSQARLAPTTML